MTSPTPAASAAPPKYLLPSRRSVLLMGLTGLAGLALILYAWQLGPFASAIKQTDDTYGRRLFVLADNIVRNDQDAEESVSDTYLRAWESIPPHRPRHFFAYLAKICRHFALDKLDWKSAAKRRAEVVSLTDEMALCIPDSQRERELEGRELGRLLDAFLRTLTPENRMVFMRRYWYVDTIAEISARFGISESAVQMRLSRTRAKLSSYLEKEGIRV